MHLENTQHKTLNLIIVLLGSLICIILIFLCSRTANSLEQNGQWNSSKTFLVKSVMNAEDFFRDGRALADNRLDLSRWHGYQEVITKNSFNMEKFEFDFRMGKNSYFYAIVDWNESGFVAIRLNTNNNRSPAFIHAKQSGEYLSTTPLLLPIIEPNSWHHASIWFIRKSSHIAISIDGQTPVVAPMQYSYSRRIGFRGSYHEALIDNIRIQDSYGQTVFREGFHFPYIRLFPIAVFIALSMIVIERIIQILLSKLSKDKYEAAFRLIVLNMTIILILIAVTIYIIGYVLHRYPNPNSMMNSLIAAIGLSEPDDLVAQGEIYTNMLLEDELPFSFAGKTILFIGASQTWGAGAHRQDAAFVNTFARLINNNYEKQGLSPYSNPFTDSYRVINASVSGAKSAFLLDKYRKHWIDFSPNVVIINLSINDDDPELFRNNLNEFVDINTERKIQTVFVLEALSSDHTPGEDSLHQVMKEVASNRSIPILDLHNHLKLFEDKGILWWDIVHLTTYGHQVTAEFLYNGVKNLLP